MSSEARKVLPSYLAPGSTITIHHVQHGEMCATVLPFSFSVRSSAQVILAKLERVPLHCPLQLNTPYIVKIFDPRFMRGEGVPWHPENEAAAAQLHGGAFEFNPKQGPSMIEVDYDEDVVAWELMLYKQCAWQHHNECLAYRHLGAAGLQGSAVPIFFGAGQLNLSGTTPTRAIKPFVLLLEYIRDAIPLDALDPRRLTEPLLHEIGDSGELLRRHDIIHTDANEANFLLVPAHNPTRVVTIDFAEAWTRDAAEDEEDWQGALREWRTTRARKVMLNMKFQNAGLPIPGSIALPQFR